MKIDRITYQKIFPTGMMYLNHKIGVEVQLDPGDDELTAFNFAKSFVEEMNLQSNPGMAAAMEYMGNGGLGYAEVLANKYAKDDEDSKGRRVALLIGDINTCTEVKVLESYRLIAKQFPEIQAAYEKKMEELTKK